LSSDQAVLRIGRNALVQSAVILLILMIIAGLLRLAIPGGSLIMLQLAVLAVTAAFILLAVAIDCEPF
jgi:hypothetical protein